MMRQVLLCGVKGSVLAALLLSAASCARVDVSAQPRFVSDAEESADVAGTVKARNVKTSSEEKPTLAQTKKLNAWLEGVQNEARLKNISDATWAAAMGGFKPIKKIVQLDRKQPEGTKTFTQYISGTVTAGRIAEGRKLYAEHKNIIDFISAHYRVPPHYIMALWGMETSYGKVTGGFSVPHALATLAYDGRRAEFFRDELLKSLQIIEQGHITAAAMKGSWAGAMGQCQFMPSAFLAFAVDADRDGHKDIWGTRYDVFASVANYLHKSGWDATVGWGMPVVTPEGFDVKLADIKSFKPMSHWTKLGIRLKKGAPLPQDSHAFALIYAGKPHEGAYLVSSNYNVILKWNRSRYFATSVGTLADAIAQQ